MIPELMGADREYNHDTDWLDFVIHKAVVVKEAVYCYHYDKGQIVGWKCKYWIVIHPVTKERIYIDQGPLYNRFLPLKGAKKALKKSAASPGILWIGLLARARFVKS